MKTTKTIGKPWKTHDSLDLKTSFRVVGRPNCQASTLGIAPSDDAVLFHGHKGPCTAHQPRIAHQLTTLDLGRAPFKAFKVPKASKSSEIPWQSSIKPIEMT